MPKLVLLRHGQSVWNRDNLFTGWTDVDLTERGLAEARQAGQLLREEGFAFDLAYTSMLKRAIRTLWTVLDEMDLMWIPVVRHWRLNERHYGALQGLDKAQTAAKHGEEQVLLWRRSYSTPPPSLAEGDDRHPGRDRRYAGLAREDLPLAESLGDMVARLLPYWRETIAPSIREGRQVIVVAHGNALRALVKHLDDVSEEAIVGLNIPTGVPLVYDLDEDLRPLGHRYLGDQEVIAEAMQAIASQGKAAH